MLPKLSVAGDLSYSSRLTVPHARSCDSKTSVAESGTCAWNSECSQRRNDVVAAASSDGGPTGGRGPPTVLEFLVINFRGPDLRK